MILWTKKNDIMSLGIASLTNYCNIIIEENGIRKSFSIYSNVMLSKEKKIVNFESVLFEGVWNIVKFAAVLLGSLTFICVSKQTLSFQK